jgi:hypothetical protein
MADITKGYTHADGGQCTGPTLNAMLDSATINAAFITAKSAITTLDNTNDYFLIYQNSSAALKKVAPGSFLSSASAVTESITQSSHGFVAGDVLYYTGSAYAKAKADALSTANAVGIVSAATDVNTFVLVYAGRISTLSGLTAGVVYYVSDVTAGALTATAPNTYVRPILIATSTTAGIVLDGGLQTVSSSAINNAICDGRITCSSGTAVTTNDKTSIGTIYFTPYKGNKIALYNGTQWSLSTFAETSLALTATSGKNYDLFGYDNAGTFAIESLIWTDDTTRATALVLQDGVLSKTGALTRRYLGTFRASGSNVTEDSFAKRFVWNYYNRVPRVLKAPLETADTWTYTTAAFRQANGNAANQLDFVIGVSEDPVRAEIKHSSQSSLTASTESLSGIGLDSTTSLAVGCLPGLAQTMVANYSVRIDASYEGYPGIGRHYLAWLEFSTASGTTTWAGDSGAPDKYQNGIIGVMRA